MTPSELSNYLRERNRASLADIAMRFDVEASAARGVLDLLIEKKRVREVSLGMCGANGGCSCAAERELTVFEYVGRRKDV